MNQWNRVEIPETNSYAYDQSSKEETKIYSEEKIAFSTMVLGKPGIYIQMNEVGLLPNTVYKN